MKSAGVREGEGDSDWLALDVHLGQQVDADSRRDDRGDVAADARTDRREERSGR